MKHDLCYSYMFLFPSVLTKMLKLSRTNSFYTYFYFVKKLTCNYTYRKQLRLQPPTIATCVKEWELHVSADMTLKHIPTQTYCIIHKTRKTKNTYVTFTSTEISLLSLSYIAVEDIIWIFFISVLDMVLRISFRLLY